MNDGVYCRSANFWRMFAIMFAAILPSDCINFALHRVWAQSRWRDAGVTVLIIFAALTIDMLRCAVSPRWVRVVWIETAVRELVEAPANRARVST